MKRNISLEVNYKNLHSYERAGQILRDFDKTNKKYLRELVANVTGNTSYANVLSFKDLRHEAYIIQGVAKRIVCSAPEFRNLVGVIENTVGLNGNDLIDAQETMACMMERTPHVFLEELSREYGRKVMGGFFR